MIIQFLIFFVAITLVFIINKGRLRTKGNLLTFAITIAMTGIPLKSFFAYTFGSITEVSGPYQNSANIYPCTIFALYFLLTKQSRIKISREFLIFVLLMVINYINPDNYIPSAVWPPFAMISQVVFFIAVIRKRYSYAQIYNAVYDSLRVWSLLEIILAICYPVLGLESATTIFFESGNSYANRRDTMSAVGTFPHPAGLACFAAMALCFFLVDYLDNGKSKTSMNLCIVNFVCLILTFSRTSYMCLAVALFWIYMLRRRKQISIKYIFYICMAFVILFSALMYIPQLNELFLQSDAEQQVDNRLIHWLIGMDIWEGNKLLGIGLNTHVSYMTNKYDGIISGMSDTPVGDFFTTNPIHNVHIQILAELGVVGITLWVLWYLFNIRKNYKNVFTGTGLSQSTSIVIVAYMFYMFLYDFFGWTFAQCVSFTSVLILIYGLAPINCNNNDENRK